MQIFKTSRSRENILRKIRKQLEGHSTAMPFPEAEKEPIESMYPTNDMAMEEVFAEAFIHAGGRFVFCDNEQELLENILTLYDNREWSQLVCADERLLQLFRNNNMSIVKNPEEAPEDADACITDCECLISRTGSIMFSSRQHYGRSSTVYYPVHLVVAYANQLVVDVAQAIEYTKQRYKGNLPSMMSVNTGPSRTADIEKTLVTGVHGPGEVFCFLVNAEK